MAFKKMAIGMACVLALVAMSGLAVADIAPENIQITPSTQTIPYSPSYATYYINVTDIYYKKVTDILNSGKHTIFPDVYDATGGAQDDLEFNFTTVDANGNRLPGSAGNTYSASNYSGWHNESWAGWPWRWGSTPGNNAWQNLRVYVRAKDVAPQSNLYRFNVTDNGQSESAHGSTQGTSIPEFPLGIIIPAAISLGIIFLVFRRRQKD